LDEIIASAARPTSSKSQTLLFGQISGMFGLPAPPRGIKNDEGRTHPLDEAKGRKRTNNAATKWRKRPIAKMGPIAKMAIKDWDTTTWLQLLLKTWLEWLYLPVA
jgi:hypothetical protein